LIGIYAGEGASHSWTWFVTVMERLGTRGFTFLAGNDLRQGDLSHLRAILIGGGDVEGMARELGEEGARGLEGFVRAGGVYLGSCAGAYLVMRDVDLPPYTPFELIDAGMANYLADPPTPLQLPHKYKVAYGEGFVFHPAYGPVRVGLEEGSFLGALGEVTAALYGGPVIVPGEGSERLAVYRGLEKGCLPLVEGPLLEEMMLGTCAAARQDCGEGRVYICGPHFECPYFPAGGKVLQGILEEENIYKASELTRRPQVKAERGNRRTRHLGADDTPEQRRLIKEIRGELSNARIAARGLESLPVRWTLGSKVWEPEKVIYYSEFLWERLPYLETCGGSTDAEEGLAELAGLAAAGREKVRELKRRLDDGEDTDARAADLFHHLRLLTLRFLETVRDHAPDYPG
jgi:hypothetical protein